MRSVMSVAGSDPGAGAGIQADARACADHRVWCGTAITALTVQDTRGVRSSHPVPVAVLVEQIRALLEDLDVGAIKLGMLGSAAHVHAVADALEGLPAGVAVVCDPVMLSSSGARLLDEEAVGVLVARVLPRATLITPNAAEAAVLAGGDDRVWAWAADSKAAVLVTGGDLPGDEVRDVLVSGGERRTWSGARLFGGPVHGTGCMLSSAIAARLARGESLVEAIDGGIAYVRRRIAAAIRPGHGSAVGGWDVG
jgi:hydroxymethylpyrimidine/phosphomethylpyrimidine kinase